MAEAAGEQIWTIDPQHTSVEFSVRHMGLFNVKGSFGKTSGSILTTDGALKSIDVTIDTSTVDTRNGDRDNHLKSPDFLDVAQFPDMRFRSTNIKPQGQDRYEVTGDLTLHGQTHPVVLQVETVPPFKDPFGLLRAGGSATGTINRKEWGLVWSQVMETGSLLVGDDIKLSLDVQGTLAQPVA